MKENRARYTYKAQALFKRPRDYFNVERVIYLLAA